MTSKDYRAVAKIIKTELEALSVLDVDTDDDPMGFRHEFSAREAQTFIFANRMADLFENDNPRFKRNTFIRACGLEK